MKTKLQSTIFGRMPIADLLERNPSAVMRIYIKDTKDRKGSQEIQKLAKQAGVPVDFIKQQKIIQLVGDDVSHQGVAADVTLELEQQTLKEWVKEVDLDKNPAVLVLSHVQDTGNFGAIIRTAVAAGISAILYSSHNQAPLSATVFKTSAGTMDKIPLIQIGNINDAIKTLQDNKFWVAGLDARGDTGLWDLDMDSPMAFVVGAEGEGVKDVTLKACDFVVTIPMSEKVESLNASVSAALLMYEWKRKRSE